MQTILKNQSQLQELTHQLSEENVNLRLKVKETFGNTIETPSPSRWALGSSAKGISPVLYK